VKWVWLSLFPIALAAQEVPTDSTIPQYILAVTYCDTSPEPKTWYRTNVEKHPLYEEVKAHEAIHIQQMKRFPNCKASVEWLSLDPQHRINFEAEAYCKTLDTSVKLGFDRRERLWQFIQMVYFLYQGRTTLYNVAQTFKSYCPWEFP